MKKATVLILVLCLSMAFLSAADYVFETYHMQMDANLQNGYAVQEQIVANFSTPRHGIYREIPIQFGKIRVDLKNLQANVPMIQDNVSSGYVTFRLGSENRTVIGPQKYIISYDYTIGSDRNNEYDELYYNLVGPGWQAPIKDFTFEVNFPKPIDPSMVYLFGGEYGSKDQRGTFTVSQDRKSITGEAKNLMPGEALTLMVQMEEGYFSEVKPFVDFTIPFTILVLFLALGAAVHATFMFRRYGKEELFVPVVRFEPPEGLTPMEVGYLADGVVDNKDLTSMIFYWADLGYLKIEEKDKKEFVFTKIKDLETDRTHELHLFDALFDCGLDGSVSLKQLEKADFNKDMERTKTEVTEYFKNSRGLKDKTAERKRVIPMLYGAASAALLAIAPTFSYIGGTTVVLLGCGFISLVLSAIVFSRLNATWEISSKFKKVIKVFALILLLVLLMAVALVIQHYVFENSIVLSFITSLAVVAIPAYQGALTIFTGKRSAYAQKTLEEIIGYREFIDKVEIEKLKMMIDSDPAFFYHVLSYAIVLGLEDVWAKKFAKIAVPQPDWYVGYSPIRGALYYSVLSHRLNTTVVQSALYTQARSASRSPIHSAFGGGGFSGGGFGGGGGGAW